MPWSMTKRPPPPATTRAGPTPCSRPTRQTGSGSAAPASGRGRRRPRCCPPSPRSWTSAPRRPSTSTGPKTSSGLELSSRGVASGLAAEVSHQAVDRRRVVGNLDLGSELLAPDLRVGEGLSAEGHARLGELGVEVHPLVGGLGHVPAV